MGAVEIPRHDATPRTSTPPPMSIRYRLLSCLLTTAVALPASGQPSTFPVGVFRSGSATITLAADGGTDIVMPDAEWKGSVRTHGDTVWVADQSPACADAGPGQYRWSLADTTLTLVPLNDPCGPRLASGLFVWHRVTGDPTVVTITARDYAFDAPDTMAAGATTIRLRNAGKDYHEVDLIRLSDGHTLADLAQAIAADQHLPWLTELGGIAGVAPGADATITLDVPAGSYALICGVPDVHGTPHAMKGMMRAVTVTGASTASLAQPDATIDMREYAFAVSQPLTVATHVVRVRNIGSERHMLVLVQLAPGKTGADVVAWDRNRVGPPPARPIGGAAEMDAGRSVLMQLHLRPGRYAMICFDAAADHKMHAEHGMIYAFTVGDR